MVTSETTVMSVHDALVRVMEDVQSVAKKDRNTSQGFNFRGIDAVVNAVAPALRKHGVVVVPHVEEYRFETVEVGKNRTPMGHVIGTVKYTFIGAGGDTIECRVLGEAMDSGDKAVPKMMSVAFRTALLQALTLPTDEPDPDASSYERSQPATDEQVAAEKASTARHMTLTKAVAKHKSGPAVIALLAEWGMVADAQEWAKMADAAKRELLNGLADDAWESLLAAASK